MRGKEPIRERRASPREAGDAEPYAELRREPGFWRHFLRTALFPVAFLALFMGGIFLFMAPFIRGQFLEQKKEQAMNLSKVVMSLFDLQLDLVRTGVKTEAQAKADALREINSIRYGKDGSGYFWIIGDDGSLLADPAASFLVGKKPEEIGPPYHDVFKQLLDLVPRIIREGKDEFLSYQWNRGGANQKDEPKIAYVRYFAPWGWAVANGLFVDDVNRQVDGFLGWIVWIGSILVFVSFLVSLGSSVRYARTRLAVSTISDSLERSREDARLKEREFETIFDTSLVGITIARADDDRIVRVNDAFRRLTGFSDDEIIGRRSVDIGIQTPEDRAAAMEIYQKAIDEGRRFENVQLTFHTKAGDSRQVRTSIVTMTLGGTALRVATYSDITDFLRIQEQLTQSQKMDTVGQLAGGIAHDFNNMLTGIMGSAEVLGMRLAGDREAKANVDVIINAAQRASELTTKLLAFSRQGKVVSTPIDLHEAIRAAVALLLRSIDKRIEVGTELGARRSWITGDPTLIQNALLNIALNARDAMPGGGSIRFRTANRHLGDLEAASCPIAVQEGDYIKVSIRDSGSGIPKEILPRIFDPFFTTKPAGKGTGLGLAAVYGTVKNHRGSISVKSDPGEGTEFSILLPLSVEQPEPKESAVGPARGYGRILVVDDESVVRSTAFAMLSNLGYDVILAENGEMGLELFMNDREEIDLVILDMVMPKLSGKETLARLLAERPDATVILSSGFNPESDMKGMDLEGAVGFIQKPYHISDLSAAVSAALAARKK